MSRKAPARDPWCKTFAAQDATTRTAAENRDWLNKLKDRSKYIACRIMTRDDLRCTQAAGSREAIEAKCAPSRGG